MKSVQVFEGNGVKEKTTRKSKSFRPYGIKFRHPPYPEWHYVIKMISEFTITEWTDMPMGATGWRHSYATYLKDGLIEKANSRNIEFKAQLIKMPTNQEQVSLSTTTAYIHPLFTNVP